MRDILQHKPRGPSLPPLWPNIDWWGTFTLDQIPNFFFKRTIKYIPIWYIGIYKPWHETLLIFKLHWFFSFSSTWFSDLSLFTSCHLKTILILNKEAESVSITQMMKEITSYPHLHQNPPYTMSLATYLTLFYHCETLRSETQPRYLHTPRSIYAHDKASE